MAITPQFQKLLDGCQEMEFSHLRPLVDRMFENADVALLDFAEKAENNMAQSVFFDAMSEVRKKRSTVEQYFYHEIQRSFSEFPARPALQNQAAGANTGLADLSLVDNEKLETTVATQNAAGKLASRIMDRIFALKQRLTIVNGGKAIEEKQIPGGPAWLGSAFQHAVESLELENKVRLVFIALFDKYVLSQVDTLFDEFNERLIQAGILPNLKYEVRKQAGGIEIVEKTITESSAGRRSSSAAAQTETPLQEQTPSELGDELFGRICELMAGRHAGVAAGHAGTNTVTPQQPGAASGSGGIPANAPGGGGETTLLSQISTLQSQVLSGSMAVSSSEFIENIEIDQNLIDRLHDTLISEREKIFGSLDRRNLPAADTNVIELVGMLFEYMLKEENLPNVVKALLSRLHTPLLKVAVLDKRFFTRSQHPARKLLNDMTSAGIRWVEDDKIDRGIFPKMKEIVDKVLGGFNDDVEIFESILQEFTDSVESLKHRAERVEQRTTEAANGQDKLQSARSRAQREVRTLPAGRPVAKAARVFLQRIWADKLTFILLRNKDGENSEHWHDATRLAGQIVESSIPPASEEEVSRRRDALVELQEQIRNATGTLQQTDKGKLMDALFETQQRLLDELATAPDTKMPELLPEEPGGQEQPEADLPLSSEQVAMLEKLKKVPFGTWFEFTQADESKKRAKLSWRSTVTRKFMFVDQMGVKATVVSMQELADSMLGGTVCIVERDEKKPFVDRAMNAIHRMLDHGMNETAHA